jgi:hypothetical protein
MSITLREIFSVFVGEKTNKGGKLQISKSEMKNVTGELICIREVRRRNGEYVFESYIYREDSFCPQLH